MIEFVLVSGFFWTCIVTLLVCNAVVDLEEPKKIESSQPPPTEEEKEKEKKKRRQKLAGIKPRLAREVKKEHKRLEVKPVPVSKPEPKPKCEFGNVYGWPEQTLVHVLGKMRCGSSFNKGTNLYAPSDTRTWLKDSYLDNRRIERDTAEGKHDCPVTGCKLCYNHYLLVVTYLHNLELEYKETVEFIKSDLLEWEWESLDSQIESSMLVNRQVEEVRAFLDELEEEKWAEIKSKYGEIDLVIEPDED